MVWSVIVFLHATHTLQQTQPPPPKKKQHKILFFVHFFYILFERIMLTFEIVFRVQTPPLNLRLPRPSKTTQKNVTFF